jgi:ATP-dependent Clp protease ATP-binding subunit ClpC
VLRRIRQLIETTGENEASLTPRSEKVLQMACLEARQLGHDYVDTEHLLLGLSREPEGGAARVLSDLGVSYEEIRRRISGTPATDE